MLSLDKIYEIALKKGMDSDPRNKKVLKRILDDNKKEYEKLDKKKKVYFDEETLRSPYPDSRILAGKGTMKVKKIMAGIDMEIGELLLAKQLGDVQMVLAHHPHGRGLIDLDRVMGVQVDTLAYSGVPVNLAEKSMGIRMGEIRKAVHVLNTYKDVQAADLLGLGYACFHTLADNCTEEFVKDHLGEKEYERLEDVVDKLLEIPEYEEGARRGDGPRIFVGKNSSRVGKMYVFMTGGTSPGDDIYEKFASSGVGTIVDMHISKAGIKKAEKHGINVVCAGHIPSDSIGINLILDEYEKKGVEIIAAGGLVRVKRF